ncbi:MAG TPA: condensation domain-containing protein, partial [Flavitalea sp.]|nr:condensation domain-containing protein [Flavitalea sp.]
MTSCISILTPLHPAQEEIFYDQIKDVESPHCNVGGYTVLRGHLDNEKFKAAISSAFEVFDVLRLKIILTNEKPYCEFLSDAIDTTINELDFSSDKNPSESAVEWMQERFGKTFNLAADALYEQALLKIAADEYWWYGRFHHLILDGHGFAIYTKYIADKYTSLVTGTVENSKFQYPQYSKEVFKAAGYPGSESYERDKLYWMEQFREVPKPLLKPRYCGDNLIEKQSGTIVINISDSQRKLLKDLSAKTNSSLQQLTLAAIAIYFGRTENRSDLVFGIPIHNRR